MENCKKFQKEHIEASIAERLERTIDLVLEIPATALAYVVYTFA
jgi:hypothetical protein